MKRHLIALGVLAGVMLLIFFVVERLGIPILTDPTPWLARSGPEAAATGVGLLIVDVLVPVPSSLVMVAHGALFGVWLGAGLSLAGGLGAALFGFALGRRGGALLARFVSPAERVQAERLLARWGALAVVVTRPVPVLAESVAMLAGSSAMGWGQMALASAAGLLPPALLYALAGSMAAGFGSAVLVFGLSLLVAGLFWWGGRRWGRRKVRVQGRGPPERHLAYVGISMLG